MSKYGIAIHGGAGDLPFWGMDGKREKEYRKGLEIAVRKGDDILRKGGTALIAVEEALCQLEDNPLFNAGIGSAINVKRRVEMDASIMCGKTLNAGAVSCISKIRNPIRLARHVMESSGHLYLTGKAAEDFAEEVGMSLVPNDFFFTQERLDWWRHEKSKVDIDFNIDSGTAGAVALDKHGDLAAGTSTGGLMMKRAGRVGDSPIIGAGTYANNLTCAVSCTGTGENIIKAVAAHEISSLLKYRSLTLHEACEKTLQEKLTPFGGQAGLAAIDRECNIKFVFNTKRMYRASLKNSEELFVEIY